MPAARDSRLMQALTTLSPRQRRLRSVTVVVLVAVVILVAIGLVHPFFDVKPPPTMTPELRRAIAVRGMIILLHWTVCMILAMSLAVLAWLDIREVQRKLRAYRMELLKELRQQARLDEDR